jgi:Na+/H+ antiporter NhaA
VSDVSIRLIAYVLLGLGALVVVLTRIRLRRRDAAGAHQVSPVILFVHTVFGLLGIVGWGVYLVTHDRSSFGLDRELIGIAALGLLWVASLVGLLILMRWLPTRGRHAHPSREDSWSDGPGLSILAHVGFFLSICFATIVYMLEKV